MKKTTTLSTTDEAYDNIMSSERFKTINTMEGCVFSVAAKRPVDVPVFPYWGSQAQYLSLSTTQIKTNKWKSIRKNIHKLQFHKYEIQKWAILGNKKSIYWLFSGWETMTEKGTEEASLTM